MKTLKWQSLINAKKLDKTQFLVFANPVSLVKNFELKNNPTNLSITKLDEPIQSGLSMFTMSSFKKIENRRDVYKVRDHRYYTIKQRGAAHNKYNLRHSVPRENSYSFSQWI